MTEMTVLHFASPFAFSMPLPAKAETRPRAAEGDEAPDAPSLPAGDTASDDGAAERLSGTDLVSAIASDAASSPVENTDPSSFYDRVLQRYREQDGPSSAPEATGGDPTEMQDRTLP